MSSPTLTIVVPLFNEERRLPALLERLATDAEKATAAAGMKLAEVVCVDDGSTDATESLLAATPEGADRARVIRFAKNRGKGAAVRAGVLAAGAELILMTDADLSTPLEELTQLAAALERGADLAIGSRSISGSQVLVHQPRHRELMGKAFHFGLRIATGVPWRDTQCGFKLFRADTTRELFRLQRISGFAFDAELCVNARRLALQVVEVPVRWKDDRDTRVALMRSSLQMGFDLARIAWRARRPLVRPRENTGLT
jgi:glycosyltransferase involved in cell wall biosynthesis